MPTIGQSAKGQTVLFDMLDWHNPLLGSAIPSSREELANSRALIAAREDDSLPDPPKTSKLNSPEISSVTEDPTGTSLDLQVFVALIEIARHTRVVIPKPKGRDALPSEMELEFFGAKHSVYRPSDDDLPDKADIVRGRMKAEARDRLDQMLAQNVEPDRHMLEAVGLFPSKYPYTHAVARLLLLVANIFCIPLKEGFRVPRPSQVTRDKEPVLRRPPWLPMPGHSAFPAGHATQCMLVAIWVDVLLQVDGKKKSLKTLARRIADNRVVAGLHYEEDNKEGFTIAKWLGQQSLRLLLSGETPMFLRLLLCAAAECGIDVKTKDDLGTLLSLGAEEEQLTPAADHEETRQISRREPRRRAQAAP